MGLALEKINDRKGYHLDIVSFYCCLSLRVLNVSLLVCVLAERLMPACPIPNSTSHGRSVSQFLHIERCIDNKLQFLEFGAANNIRHWLLASLLLVVCERKCNRWHCSCSYPLMDSQRMLPAAAATNAQSMSYARTNGPAIRQNSLSFVQQLMSSHRSLVHASLAAQQSASVHRKGSARVTGGNWDVSLANVGSKPRQKPSDVLSPRHHEHTAYAPYPPGCN